MPQDGSLVLLRQEGRGQVDRLQNVLGRRPGGGALPYPSRRPDRGSWWRLGALAATLSFDEGERPVYTVKREDVKGLTVERVAP